MENSGDHPGDSRSPEDTRRELCQALSECGRLQKENARLRRLLSAHGITLPPEFEESASPQPAGPANGHTTISDKSAPEEKIALFRRLFRGREDVYAVRGERPADRSGYLPASIRDWKAVLSSKPSDRKRVDKKTRTLLPVTEEVIRKHLTGRLPSAFTRCYRTRRAGFSLWTSTRRAGSWMPQPFSRPAVGSMGPQHGNAPGPAMAVTSGFSSTNPVRRSRLASEDVSF